MDDYIRKDTARRIIDSPRNREQMLAILEDTPSEDVQPEARPIDYQDCSNAMLKMWMDNVVTDGEYNRIMDKLNAHWGKKDG